MKFSKGLIITLIGLFNFFTNQIVMPFVDIPANRNFASDHFIKQIYIAQKQMDAGQNVLALMMKKKRAEGSLDMPIVKKKKKKQKLQPVQLPSEPPKPPTPPTPPPPLEEGKLNVIVIEQNLPEDNQFFDAECKAADEQLQRVKKQQEQKQKFGKKLRKVNGLMARLHASVQQIKSRYTDLDIQELLSKRVNKDKVAQAHAFVVSQKVKKKKFNDSIDSVKKKEEGKKQKEEMTKEESEAKERERVRKEMMKDLENQKKEKLKEKEEMMKRQEKAKQVVEKFQHDKPLYVRLQLKQEVKDKKQQQIVEVFLQKRGEKFKPVEFKEIGSHMKAHKEHLRDQALVKQHEHLQKHHQLMHQNLKLLQKIYRGKNYEMVQQQEQERRLLRLRAKAQREKIKKYESYVRENFKPQVREEQQDQNAEEKAPQKEEEENQDNQENQENQDEIQKREKQEEAEQYRKIKRYKFLQGKSCGEIIQTVKVPLSERLQRRLGDGYLQHALNLPKKRLSKEQQRQLESASFQVINPVKKPIIEIPQIPRPKHYSVSVSQTPNRKQLSNMLELLKSKDSQAEMKQRHLLRAIGDKDKFEYKGAGSVHDDIISNIERKLSLLHQL